MSKVYKSNNIQMGSPKPIINKFAVQAAGKAVSELEQEAAAAGEGLEHGADDAANMIIEDAKQMYLKIIEEANYEAQTIIERAGFDAENLRAAAKEEGFSEGYAVGYEEGKRSVAAIIDEAAEIREFLDSRKDRLYREAEEEIVALVIEISKKVIGDEINNNPNVIIQLIKQALERCAFKNKLVVRVSPEDYQYAADNKDYVCRLTECVQELELIADISLGKGSCIVETPSGEINSSADVQIKELEKALLFLLRNE